MWNDHADVLLLFLIVIIHCISIITNVIMIILLWKKQVSGLRVFIIYSIVCELILSISQIFVIDVPGMVITFYTEYHSFLEGYPRIMVKDLILLSNMMFGVRLIILHTMAVFRFFFIFRHTFYSYENHIHVLLLFLSVSLLFITKTG
ncbi:unnamed protein product [Caenorhabditis angaria]|uniref:Uncharacterized protein n=1 Tax=Caenorhabditis angaria TaxID=860376 RepID=A0A9P1J0U6_9PELO|nr:unnamed protein product [Caenorhabditis angaria]